ncbi:MAG: hypothetical protein CMJ32_09255 [Phycisphaerae bacterium]|nr:hypothetical protein [Phycisphaerae bacterium]
MGQLALGFQSLLFKLAIFVVMAALLAWALGGTLWPRSQWGIVSEPLGGWAIRVEVTGAHEVHYHLAASEGGEWINVLPREGADSWSSVAGPVRLPDGGILIAALVANRWEFFRSTGGDPGSFSLDDMWMAPDRYMVEQILRQSSSAPASTESKES